MGGGGPDFENGGRQVAGTRIVSRFGPELSPLTEFSIFEDGCLVRHASVKTKQAPAREARWG